jgi:hypothetical protein
MSVLMIGSLAEKKLLVVKQFEKMNFSDELKSEEGGGESDG